ncbi:MAG: hypothetical protein AABX73_01265 [Nanoarchaeota archaeon]
MNSDKLVKDLFISSKEESRCPHIRMDERGAYWANGLGENTNIWEERRMVCDFYSLQLWCLHPKKYNRCIYFQNGFTDNL